MSVKIKVKVTREILEHTQMCGIKSIMENCAIAVALRDVFGKVQVGEDQVDFLTNTSAIPYATTDLPDEARIFIERFDRSIPERRVMMPELEFEIDVPDVVINRMGNMGEVKKLISSSKTVKLCTN